MYSIVINNLSHKFSKNTPILNNISLSIPKGSIYGFLGPNGAGKTTTLKILLGLIKKQSGEISLLDKNIEDNRLEILQSIGSLIEMPSIYAHLSAYENLLVWQKIYDCDISRINKVLEIVGLNKTDKKKAGSFSLGMKQRLGIAIALLHNPKLLILDEPTNGLDPNGIIEIRELLINLNKQEGVTILISSHLLSEIEKLVTHIGIINNGNVLFEGSLDKFIQMQDNFTHIIIKSSNNIKVKELLPTNLSSKFIENGIEVSISSESETANFIKLLVKHDINIYEVITKKSDLESAFMNLLKK